METAMNRINYLLLPIVALVLVVTLPTVSASSATTGIAKQCTAGIAYCTYNITNANGSGWAFTTPTSISFPLPGESNYSYGGQYSAKVVNVSGKLDHVKGSFVATDVNTGKILFGLTDTNITVVKHCSHTGCGYTYTLVNGSIVFHPTHFDGTLTALTCSPSTFQDGNSTKCTAKVSDLANSSNVVNGNVSFFTYVSYIGTFSHGGVCTLLKGSCSVQWTPADGESGPIHIYANYQGHYIYYKSQGNALVDVTPSD
jgi:hypothetical protein